MDESKICILTCSIDTDESIILAEGDSEQVNGIYNMLKCENDNDIYNVVELDRDTYENCKSNIMELNKLISS